MIIDYFDVTARRINEEDLELIRYWRNTEKISSKMQYREVITREMHREWYKKINNIQIGFAFIIEYRKQPVGMIHSFDNIDSEFSEGGMFFWEDYYWSSNIPVMVSTALSDVGFYIGQNKYSYIKVLRDNINAINYNKQFGYEICKGEEDKPHQQYILELEKYVVIVKKIKDRLEGYYGYSSNINLFVEHRDIKEGLLERFPMLQEENHQKVLMHGIVVKLP
jgi:UDP-4-amino-4,6-dideoxy-N-acetyl-beta-L-altrosamine N-acetyltransferase